jgi:hypothetical protein
MTPTTVKATLPDIFRVAIGGSFYRDGQLCRIWQSQP